MRRRGLLLGAVVLLLLVKLLGQAPVRAVGPIDPARLSALDDYLAGAREDMGVPGLAVVVVEGDAIVHLTTLGVADSSGRPITAQTPFLLASTSKAFTALAVMQLVEAGKLDLDAPVQRYLPWFTVADTAEAARITPRQLLYHTSGLSTVSGQAYHDSDDQDIGALERMVRGLAGSDLVSAPGAEYHYTNTGYDMLGLIVQTISGQPFSDYIDQHVFTPLDMRHSHATVESARADGLAAGYYNWFGLSWQPYATPLPRAGGPSATMFVSAEDLGHEIIAHLNGGTYGAGRVLSAAGIATMHAPGVKVDAFHGYAMGWGLRPLWELLDPTAPGGGPAFTLPGLVEHGGGWPNAHTFVGLVPAEGWGVALLVNAADFAQSSRFSLLDQNILRILEGSEPADWTPGEELLSRYGRLVAALLLVAQLVSLAWSFRSLRRTRAMAAGVGSRSLVITAVAALALDALIVWLLLAYVPERYESTFSVLLRESPDLAILGLPALALALIWGPLRTVLLLTGIVRSRRPTASAVPV